MVHTGPGQCCSVVERLRSGVAQSSVNNFNYQTGHPEPKEAAFSRNLVRFLNGGRGGSTRSQKSCSSSPFRQGGLDSKAERHSQSVCFQGGGEL